ncbi:MAG TPA: response regulator transcription factor [Candidatus Binataceae bacterium]|jgi:DNA-binding NarL/FixJ family response regulator|nr:response regulator transcription factor [Candidatus Binataceae bacterium]
MSKPEQTIRVMLADDHRILMGSLKVLLERHGCEIVGEATTGEQALAIAAKVHPQVIILDLEMAGTGGLAAAHRMKEAAPAAKVLILSAYEDESDVLEALNEAGVAGYMVKGDAPEELVSAVRTVAIGKRYLSPSIAPILLSQLRNPRPRGIEGNRPITRREHEVLRLLSEGATSKDIASKLGISPKTAQAHRENLKDKLSLRTTAELVRYAIQHKIVKLE